MSDGDDSSPPRKVDSMKYTRHKRKNIDPAAIPERNRKGATTNRYTKKDCRELVQQEISSLNEEVYTCLTDLFHRFQTKKFHPQRIAELTKAQISEINPYKLLPVLRQLSKQFESKTNRLEFFSEVINEHWRSCAIENVHSHLKGEWHFEKFAQQSKVALKNNSRLGIGTILKKRPGNRRIILFTNTNGTIEREAKMSDLISLQLPPCVEEAIKTLLTPGACCRLSLAVEHYKLLQELDAATACETLIQFIFVITTHDFSEFEQAEQLENLLKCAIKTREFIPRAFNPPPAPSPEPEPPQEGDIVEAEFEDKWLPATIKTVKASTMKVVFLGWTDEYELPKEKVRTLGDVDKQYNAKQLVEAEYDGAWHDARIKKVISKHLYSVEFTQFPGDLVQRCFTQIRDFDPDRDRRKQDSADAGSRSLTPKTSRSPSPRNNRARRNWRQGNRTQNRRQNFNNRNRSPQKRENWRRQNDERRQHEDRRQQNRDRNKRYEDRNFPRERDRRGGGLPPPKHVAAEISIPRAGNAKGDPTKPIHSKPQAVQTAAPVKKEQSQQELIGRISQLESILQNQMQAQTQQFSQQQYSNNMNPAYFNNMPYNQSYSMQGQMPVQGQIPPTNQTAYYNYSNNNPYVDPGYNMQQAQMPQFYQDPSFQSQQALNFSAQSYNPMTGATVPPQSSQNMNAGIPNHLPHQPIPQATTSSDMKLTTSTSKAAQQAPKSLSTTMSTTIETSSDFVDDIDWADEEGITLDFNSRPLPKLHKETRNSRASSRGRGRSTRGGKTQNP